MTGFSLHPLGKKAQTVLRIQLLLTMLFSVVLLISFLNARKVDAVLANSYYAQLAEYIMCDLFICALSCVVIEALDTDSAQRR